jgi:hypothetical protein
MIQKPAKQTPACAAVACGSAIALLSVSIAPAKTPPQRRPCSLTTAIPASGIVLADMAACLLH